MLLSPFKDGKEGYRALGNDFLKSGIVGDMFYIHVQKVLLFNPWLPRSVYKSKEKVTQIFVAIKTCGLDCAKNFGLEPGYTRRKYTKMARNVLLKCCRLTWIFAFVGVSITSL